MQAPNALELHGDHGEWTKDLNAYPILTVLIIATASVILAEIPSRFRVPAVVWMMLFGMIVGPHLLGLARPIGRFTMFGERVGS